MSHQSEINRILTNHEVRQDQVGGRTAQALQYLADKLDVHELTLYAPNPQPGVEFAPDRNEDEDPNLTDNEGGD